MCQNLIGGYKGGVLQMDEIEGALFLKIVTLQKFSSTLGGWILKYSFHSIVL
jgi:hypothetical protein